MTDAPTNVAIIVIVALAFLIFLSRTFGSLHVKVG